jgi:hypothetical protein
MAAPPSSGVPKTVATPWWLVCMVTIELIDVIAWVKVTMDR